MIFGTYYHVSGQAIRARKSKNLRTGYSFIELTSQNENVDAMDKAGRVARRIAVNNPIMIRQGGLSWQ